LSGNTEQFWEHIGNAEVCEQMISIKFSAMQITIETIIYFLLVLQVSKELTRAMIGTVRHGTQSILLMIK